MSRSAAEWELELTKRHWNIPMDPAPIIADLAALEARIADAESLAHEWERSCKMQMGRVKAAEKERDELKRKYGGKTNA